MNKIKNRREMLLELPKRWFNFFPPSMASMEEWDEHDQKFKKEAPIRYSIKNNITKLCFNIKSKWHKIRVWFLAIFKREYRFDRVYLYPGKHDNGYYIDPKKRMELAIMSIFCSEMKKRISGNINDYIDDAYLTGDARYAIFSYVWFTNEMERLQNEADMLYKEIEDNRPEGLKERKGLYQCWPSIVSKWPDFKAFSDQKKQRNRKSHGLH